MGTVWRALDLRSNEVVAAKVLRQSHATALMRFVREQSIRIHHPHIVVPLGWAGEDDRVLFTMPIIHGGSVETLVGDFGPLPPGFVAEVLRQILSALHAVHTAKLIHRDIKPANILLDATGRERPHAYLSDFGIAIDMMGPRFTEIGSVTGTPGYLAPELAALEDPTPAADLYAAGMVAAHMLTSLRPADINLTSSAPHQVPLSLWSLVAALTASNPAHRPSLSEALARLDDPELGWSARAVGNVDVFNHLDTDADETTSLLTSTIGSTPTRLHTSQETPLRTDGVTGTIQAVAPASPSRLPVLGVYSFFGSLVLIGLLVLVLS